MHALRKIMSSKLGAAIGLLFIAAMGIGFIAGDITGLTSGGQTGGNGGAIARIGDETLRESELRQRVNQAFEQARAERPGLDQAAFVNGGGFDDVMTQLVNAMALEAYAKRIGLGVSRRLVDGRIADIPAFQGIDGKFSQTKFVEMLRSRGISEKELRADIARELLIGQLITPTGAAARATAAFADPYARMMLEKRSALATFIPADAYAPVALPTDAALSAYINANAARYRQPEQRVVRYALFDVKNAPATPVTDEQIADFYKKNQDRFTASETRHFTQVIAPDEAQARALAAKTGSGSLSATAKAMGLTAARLTMKDEASLAAALDPAIARQGFTAARGALLGPVKGPLGWVVLSLDAIDTVRARTLAEAKPDIAKTLAGEQDSNALRTFYNKLQDELEGGASAPEIARRHGLTIVSSPLVTNDGHSLSNPAYRLGEGLAPVLQSAFLGAEAGKGAVIQIGDGRFALVDAAQIVPPSVPALSAMRARVLADYRRGEGNRKARELARAITDQVNKGVTLADAIKASGARGGPVSRVGGQRAQAASPQTPREVAALFSMAPGSAKTIALPNDAGWMVVYLDTVVPAPAAPPQLIAGIQSELGRALGNEYVAQMLAAAKRAVRVKIDDAAVARLKKEMLGSK